jgi:hypothetical protein
MNVRRTSKGAIALLAVLTLGACATYKPVPDGYSGPLAVISDSGARESGTRARLFAVVAIDGNTIPNSFSESNNASAGKGFSLLMRIVTRQVPARAMKVTLLGSHTTAAAIHAIFSRAAGTYQSAQGVVDFAPAPDGEYVVRGDLGPNGSAVWIEDSRSGQAVTQRIQSK